jgi:hypothetical protein
MYVPVYILPTLAVATKFGLMLFKKFSDIKITKLKFLYLKQISLLLPLFKIQIRVQFSND